MLAADIACHRPAHMRALPSTAGRAGRLLKDGLLKLIHDAKLGRWTSIQVIVSEDRVHAVLEGKPRCAHSSCNRAAEHEFGVDKGSDMDTLGQMPFTSSHQ